MIDVSQVREQSRVLAAVRAFFQQHLFEEIEIPVLHSALPLEPNLFSFQTQWRAAETRTDFYLTTSPESTLKKCLAAGIKNCFGIGHCFRNLEGSGALHQPEFLMLEWYRSDARYTEIMTDVQALVRSVKDTLDVLSGRPSSSLLDWQGQQFDLATDWPVISLERLYRQHVDLELSEITTDDRFFFNWAQHKGYTVSATNWGELFDQVFLNEIEQHLPKQPCFLIDFPARMSPLCATDSQRPYVAERFEVFIGGIEIANGNTENTNAAQIQQMMEAEQVWRQNNHLPTHPIDAEFLAAVRTLQATGKNFAGIGLGVDRLAMILGNKDSILTTVR